MNIIGFDDKIVIPVDKIVEVFFDPEDKRKVNIWLQGGFTQTIISQSEEKAVDVFNSIRKELIES